MSISGVNCCSDPRDLLHQRLLDFKTLASAVESGDPVAAKAALQSYQNDVQTVAPVPSAGDASDSGSFAAKIKVDLSNLATAVQSGHLDDAKVALTAYQQDRQAVRQGTADAASSPGSSPVETLSSLLTSFQSGDSKASAAAQGTTDGGSAFAKASKEKAEPIVPQALILVIKQFTEALLDTARSAAPKYL